MSRLRNIGELLNQQLGLTPFAVTATGTRNGASIDRKPVGSNLQLDSARLTVQSGTVTGGPSTSTVDVKIQDSADGSSFADLSPAQAITQITAADGLELLDVDLSGARQFVRVVEDVVLSGGASPTIIAGCTLQFATNVAS